MNEHSAMATDEPEPPLTVIERESGWRAPDWAEMWRARELLYYLAWRDVAVRYKQTALGGAWAVAQPLTTMVVFSLFLGRLPASSSGDLPYPLYFFAGLVPWMFFANGVNASSSSVVGSQNLVSKVYFPRLFLPIGTVAAFLVDFAISLVMLVVLMAYYRVGPGSGVWAAPVATLGMIAAVTGIGLLLSAAAVAYRDVRHVVPFCVQLWMFATPTIYMRTDGLLGRWGESLLPLNPAEGLIYNFRAALLGRPLDLGSLAVSSLVGVACLVGGALYFRRVEQDFADQI